MHEMLTTRMTLLTILFITFFFFSFNLLLARIAPLVCLIAKIGFLLFYPFLFNFIEETADTFAPFISTSFFFRCSRFAYFGIQNKVQCGH